MTIEDHYAGPDAQEGRPPGSSAAGRRDRGAERPLRRQHLPLAAIADTLHVPEGLEVSPNGDLVYIPGLPRHVTTIEDLDQLGGITATRVPGLADESTPARDVVKLPGIPAHMAKSAELVILAGWPHGRPLKDVFSWENEDSLLAEWRVATVPLERVTTPGGEEQFAIPPLERDAVFALRVTTAKMIAVPRLDQHGQDTGDVVMVQEHIDGEPQFTTHLVPHWRTRNVGQISMGPSIAEPPQEWRETPRHPVTEDSFVVTVNIGMFGGTYRNFVEQYLQEMLELGVTHVHLIPTSSARPGEKFTNGYDANNPFDSFVEFGPQEDLAWMYDTLNRAGIGVIVDVAASRFANAGESLTTIAPFINVSTGQFGGHIDYDGPAGETARRRLYDWAAEHLAMGASDVRIDDACGYANKWTVAMLLDHLHTFGAKGVAEVTQLVPEGEPEGFWVLPRNQHGAGAGFITKKAAPIIATAVAGNLGHGDFAGNGAENLWKLGAPLVGYAPGQCLITEHHDLSVSSPGAESWAVNDPPARWMATALLHAFPGVHGGLLSHTWAGARPYGGFVGIRNWNATDVANTRSGIADKASRSRGRLVTPSEMPDAFSDGFAESQRNDPADREHPFHKAYLARTKLLRTERMRAGVLREATTWTHPSGVLIVNSTTSFAADRQDEDGPTRAYTATIANPTDKAAVISRPAEWRNLTIAPSSCGVKEVVDIDGRMALLVKPGAVVHLIDAGLDREIRRDCAELIGLAEPLTGTEVMPTDRTLMPCTGLQAYPESLTLPADRAGYPPAPGAVSLTPSL